MIATDLAQGGLVKLKHYLAQFRSSRIPGRKALAVNFTQRLDKGVAVLAADFAILVAMAMVETWFAHAALPWSVGQRLSLRGRNGNRERTATSNCCCPPGSGAQLDRAGEGSAILIRRITRLRATASASLKWRGSTNFADYRDRRHHEFKSADYLSRA
jgi:hypothetical protein